MKFACVLFGAAFLAAGALFAAGKGHIHLRAWKEMPREEKERIQIGPLCRNIGEMIALSGAIFLLKGLWPGFRNRWFVIAMAVWMIAAGLDVWYIGRSGRYGGQ